MVRLVTGLDQADESTSTFAAQIDGNLMKGEPLLSLSRRLPASMGHLRGRREGFPVTPLGGV